MPASNYSVEYSFGDSLSDAGNVYLLSSSGIASDIGLSPIPVSPPYAQLNYNGVSANVFSNGPVWSQDLAVKLGLPEPAPSGAGATADTLRSALTPLIGGSEASAAVTALEIKAGVSVTGDPYVPVIGGASSNATDFAIGGSLSGVTTENSASTVQLYDLNAQLTTFQHDVPTPQANALATVSMGGNDVINLVEDANLATLYPVGTTLANVGSTQAGTDVQQSVSAEAAFLTGLIADGVDNIAVMNVPDVGVIPEITALGTADAGDATVLSQYYNQLLAGDVTAMNSSTAHVTIVDAFTLMHDAISDPSPFGLTNTSAPVYSGSSSNFVSADLVSSDPAVQDTYLFFDKEHPTETGQTALSNVAFQALGVPCFAAGTRIRTADGEVPVERLRLGARVLLAEGGVAPVTWIGRTLIDCARHPDPRAVWPVRVRAGAFAAGVPERDLHLSPDHAVFVEGTLVPVRYLLNGRTITQNPCVCVEYFHIELPSHAVLLAEGLAAESYLDTGNREMLATATPAAAWSAAPRHAPSISRMGSLRISANTRR